MFRTPLRARWSVTGEGDDGNDDETDAGRRMSPHRLWRRDPGPGRRLRTMEYRHGDGCSSTCRIDGDGCANPAGDRPCVRHLPHPGKSLRSPARADRFRILRQAEPPQPHAVYAFTSPINARWDLAWHPCSGFRRGAGRLPYLHADSLPRASSAAQFACGLGPRRPLAGARRRVARLPGGRWCPHPALPRQANSPSKARRRRSSAQARPVARRSGSAAAMSTAIDRQDFVAPIPAARLLGGAERCDDGNLAADDGCDAWL